jgi:exoribonuclease R
METVKKYLNTYITESNKKIEKNILYEYLLPEDKVKVEYLDDQTCNIISLIERNEIKTIGVVRRFGKWQCFLTLPLQSDLYLYPLVNMYSNGDILMIKTNKDDFNVTILGYYGNISNLKSIKIAIKSLINIYDKDIINTYLKNLPTLSTPNYTSEYKNLCDLDTFNIDNNNTIDIDDCISICNDTRTIYVHITDITKSMEIGSWMDIKALSRCINLYLIDYNINCISKAISQNILSLLPNVKRDVITIEFKIDEGDEIIASSIKIYESTIINKKSYTYDEFKVDKYEWVLKFIDKWKLINNSLPYLKLHIKNRDITFSINDNNKISYKFVETLMIITNIIITNRLDSLKLNFLYKNHPKTFPKTYKEIDNISEKYLYYLENKHKFKNISNGHYGLPIINYTTFTSPIRKYNDIMIHHILKGYVYNDVISNELCKYIHDMEKLAKRMTKWYFDIVFKKYLKYNWKTPMIANILSVKEDEIEVYISELLLHKTIKIKDNKKYIPYSQILVYPELITPYNIILTI